MAGVIPTIRPMMQERIKVMVHAVNSRSLGIMSFKTAVTFGAVTMVSICRKPSERAKSPISMGTKENPPVSSIIPKVKRGNPPMGSRPTMAIRRPRAPEIRPFKGDRPASETTTERPNTAKAKYSGALNRRAKLARIGAKKVRQRAVNVPPIPEAIVAMPIAFPAIPFWASGYPSKMVATAAGVPGVLIRMEAIPPP